MSEGQAQQRTPNLQELAAEVARLRERVEDLEDARELDAAIRRNGDKPLLPWDRVKEDLGLA
jgi:cell division protein FtsB